MTTFVEHNIERIQYLLDLYRININDFLEQISIGLKNKIKQEDIFGKEIKLSLLKRIDKLFNKGLEFYLNPFPISKKSSSSIFFRKDKFGTELNLGSKQIISKFEDELLNIRGLSKLSKFEINRKLDVYTLNDDPDVVAKEIRGILYPSFNYNFREFLKSFINKLGDYNILVFEFIETHNKKNKANINGVFIGPNTIILKRNQKALRREIFTLAHELGHYLLNEEEVEEVTLANTLKNEENKVERWCNEFAYHFLVGEYDDYFKNIEIASSNNDYHHDLIEQISKSTNLSPLALFTRLLYLGKLSLQNYNIIKDDIETRQREKEEAEKRKRELDKLNGKKGGSTPKPINSSLYLGLLQSALYEGVINEYDFCTKLKIKPEQIDKYI